MKRLLTLCCAVLCSATLALAQLADGSTAPNFKAKDINGRTWDLYEILESGRPVIMDISATWCGPCWSYHNSNALETYFAAHGPEGDARSFVFFVEGDGSTNTNCLYSSLNCNSSTQGNWVNGTEYPILDNANIANDYQIGYFPTVYLICPDKKVRELGTLNATQLWNQASPCKLDVPAVWAKVAQFDAGARSLQFCGPQRVRPSVNLTNFGTEHLTSATVDLRWNGTTIQTKTVSADIKPLDQTLVVFDSLDVTEPGTFTVEVNLVNDQANAEVASAEVAITAPAPKFVGQQIELRLRTDQYAKDLYWVVYDDNGNVIKEGGNVLVGAQGGGAFPAGAPADPSAYGDNLQLRDTFTVPNQCFTFLMVDAVGDGMKVPGNFKLHNLGSPSSFYGVVGNFGANAGQAFSQISSGTVDVSPIAELAVFPNPVSDELQIQYALGETANVRLWVSNSVGQIVLSQNAQTRPSGEQQQSLSVGNLTNGLYFLNLQGERGSVVAKPFVVMH